MPGFKVLPINQYAGFYRKRSIREKRFVLSWAFSMPNQYGNVALLLHQGFFGGPLHNDWMIVCYEMLDRTNPLVKSLGIMWQL